MDNSMSARPRSSLKGDPYRAYEELPAEVRRALQEALVDWCPLRAREWHQRLLREQRLRPAQAVSFLVQTIRRQDQAEVTAFARTWPKGAEAYPHLAAGATLQRYAGAEGIPAPEPLPLAPAPKPPAAPQRKAAQPKAAQGKATKRKAAQPAPAPRAASKRTAPKRARPAAKRKQARRGRR